MTQPLLVVQQLVKQYGAVLATQGLDLTLMPGEMHALIGPNGAGKTTLIGPVPGEITPDAGRRQFAGHDITALPMHQRVARGITRSYQITSLFPHLRGRGYGGKRCYELSPLRPTMARDKFSLVLACMCSQEKWLRC